MAYWPLKALMNLTHPLLSHWRLSSALVFGTIFTSCGLKYCRKRHLYSRLQLIFPNQQTLAHICGLREDWSLLTTIGVGCLSLLSAISRQYITCLIGSRSNWRRISSGRIHWTFPTSFLGMRTRFLADTRQSDCQNISPKGMWTVGKHDIHGHLGISTTTSTSRRLHLMHRRR